MQGNFLFVLFAVRNLDLGVFLWVKERVVFVWGFLLKYKCLLPVGLQQQQSLLMP